MCLCRRIRIRNKKIKKKTRNFLYYLLCVRNVKDVPLDRVLWKYSAPPPPISRSHIISLLVAGISTTTTKIRKLLSKWITEQVDYCIYFLFHLSLFLRVRLLTPRAHQPVRSLLFDEKVNFCVNFSQSENI